MRRLIIALSLALSSAVAAQEPHTVLQIDRTQLVTYKSNCNPFQIRHDAVWIHGEGWRMPRIGWWTMYSTGNYWTAKGLTKIGVNRKVAAVGTTLALGLIPHLRQAALGLKHGQVYQLNFVDWAGDAWIRSLPTWDMLAHENHSKKEYAIWLGGVAGFACFVSP